MLYYNRDNSHQNVLKYARNIEKIKIIISDDMNQEIKKIKNTASNKKSN